MGKKYPAVMKLWENAWAEFVPLLQPRRPGWLASDYRRAAFQPPASRFPRREPIKRARDLFLAPCWRAYPAEA